MGRSGWFTIPNVSDMTTTSAFSVWYVEHNILRRRQSRKFLKWTPAQLDDACISPHLVQMSKIDS